MIPPFTKGGRGGIKDFHFSSTANFTLLIDHFTLII
jgi:hypothetical protein